MTPAVQKAEIVDPNIKIVDPNVKIVDPTLREQDYDGSQADVILTIISQMHTKIALLPNHILLGTSSVVRGDINDTIVCDDKDDSNDDEVYSDCRNDTWDFSKVVSSQDNIDDEMSYAGNLVCPGNVAEYSNMTGREYTKRNLVLTIIDTVGDTYTILRSSVILRTTTHMVHAVL